MALKTLFYVSILCIAVIGCNSSTSSRAQSITDQPAYSIKEKLNRPFGTLVKLKVEIVDGETLKDKYHASAFLFKIKSVDSISLPGTPIMEFRDETGDFPNEENDKMKKSYVGREFNVVAYETGEFTGAPEGYYNYQPERQDFVFHFNNYLLVVADLTKAN